MTSQRDLKAYDMPRSRLSCIRGDAKGTQPRVAGQIKKNQELDLPDTDRGPVEPVKAPTRWRGYDLQRSDMRHTTCCF